MMLLVTHDTEQLNAPKKLCPLMCHLLFCTSAMTGGPDLSCCVSAGAVAATTKADTQEPTVTAKRQISLLCQSEIQTIIVKKKKKKNRLDEEQEVRNRYIIYK